MRKESLRDDLVELRKPRPTRASRMWEVTMAVKLDEYRELLEGINPTLRDSLTANFTVAARVMSPAALHYYLEGARALSQLGRGNDLVVSFLDEMPAVVKDAGEDVLMDCINAALKLASLVSGEIISLLFATLPTAARRLGEIG